jgi:ribosomal protein S18 acetylase RimI-like enzyme
VSSGDQMTPAASVGIVPMTTNRVDSAGQVSASSHHPVYPQWNLETLGIRRAAQGGGICSRLLAPGVARADDAGLPCYLITAKEQNLAFYERFGFEATLEALPLVPGGPTHWGMRRLPMTTR